MSKVFVQRLQLKLSITHLRVAQQMILLGQILFVGLSIYLCRTGFHVYLCCAAWLILNCKEEPLILDYTSDCDREKVVKRFCSRAGPHYIFAVQKCQKIDEIWTSWCTKPAPLLDILPHILKRDFAWGGLVNSTVHGMEHDLNVFMLVYDSDFSFLWTLALFDGLQDALWRAGRPASQPFLCSSTSAGQDMIW